MSTSPVTAPTIAPAATASHGFLKSHFAPAFFFLSPERRRALQTVYGFFRTLDDAVDTPADDPAPYLDAWREVLRDRRAAAVAPWGQESRARDLLTAVEKFGVPTFALLDFIDRGVAVDMGRNRFETPMDTESYCYGVAGTVGIACLPIFGAPVDDAKDFAVRLGVAVQWINIVRDVGADARMNRIYLPQSHLEQFGCAADDILAGRATPALAELMRHEAEVARSHFRRAKELFPTKWARELRPAWIMGRIYRDLLDKVERAGFPVFTKRVSLNIVEKAASTIRALKEQA